MATMAQPASASAVVAGTEHCRVCFASLLAHLQGLPVSCGTFQGADLLWYAPLREYVTPDKNVGAADAASPIVIEHRSTRGTCSSARTWLPAGPIFHKSF